MRIATFIALAFLIYLLGTTGCTPCECCSNIIIADVTCVKDSTQTFIFTGGSNLQSVTANTQDTFNYYTAKGYTCTKFIGPDPNDMYQVCGHLRIKEIEHGGGDCASGPGYVCD